MTSSTVETPTRKNISCKKKEKIVLKKTVSRQFSFTFRSSNSLKPAKVLPTPQLFSFPIRIYQFAVHKKGDKNSFLPKVESAFIQPGVTSDVQNVFRSPSKLKLQKYAIRIRLSVDDIICANCDVKAQIWVGDKRVRKHCPVG